MEETEDFYQEGIFKFWASKRKCWPNLTRMWEEYHGSPATTAPGERLFSKAGRQFNDLTQGTLEETLSCKLKGAINTKLNKK